MHLVGSATAIPRDPVTRVVRQFFNGRTSMRHPRGPSSPSRTFAADREPRETLWSRLKAKIPVTSANPNVLLQAAERAFAAEAFDQAAELFSRAAQAFQSAPEASSSSWMRAGNCFKDIGRFTQAYTAYQRALALTPRTGDCFLQLGHLFKLSGNFRASRLAYARALELGDERARPELANFSGVTPIDIRIDDTGFDETTRRVMQSLAACDLAAERQADNLVETIRVAALALLAAGERPLARAFADAAFLSDKAAEAFERHRRFVAETNLWTGEGRRSLSDALRQSAERLPEARQRLVAIVATAAEPPDDLTDAPIPVTRGASVGGLFDADAPQAALPAAVGAVHDSLLFLRETGARQLVKDVRQLAAIAGSSGSAVALYDIGAAPDVRPLALRTLNDLAADWLIAATPRYLSVNTHPQLIARLATVSGNPLKDRLDELGSAEKLFREVDCIIHASLQRCDQTIRDRAWGAVLAACLPPEIGADAVIPQLDRSTSYRAPFIASALISIHRTRIGRKDAATEATILKNAGLFAEALDLLRPQLVETTDLGLLAEAAILAKINGEFKLSADLFERLYARNPNDGLRREIAMVLPETEDINSILGRYGKDYRFLELAREYPRFRLAFGDALLPGHGEGDAAGQIVPAFTYELRPSISPQIEWRPTTDIERIGWREFRSADGVWPKLAPVDFVRVRTASEVEVILLRARIDGRTVGATTGSPLTADFEGSPLVHQMFNCWLDLNGVERGFHELELYFEQADSGYRAERRLVYVDPAAPENERSPASVRLPDPLAAEGRDIVERVRGLPTERFPARRALLDGTVRKVLLIRADQLGDTCQSIGGMSMLRAAYPDASFECLAAPGNRELLVSLGFFDAVHTVELTYDMPTRRRYASVAEQERLSRLFADKTFDLAVDLCPGSDTQNLLLLTGARFTAGFKPDQFRWLHFGVDVRSHDAINTREVMPHSAMIESFVAALLRALRHEPTRVAPPPHTSETRALFGLSDDEDYVVLHAGSRLLIKRWPVQHFVDLARLTTAAGIKTVLLADDREAFKGVDLSGIDRSRLVTWVEKVPFTAFQALVGNSAGFVGNDTGPKHLAALHGVPVVSIHMGQVNWSEWGQDSGGEILARRVPCAGCGIERPEECGRDLVCLKDISAEDAFRSLMACATIRKSDPTAPILENAA